MCGIAGVFGTSDRALVGEMLRALVHRGPDDEHLVADAQFCFGARRLSIIDVDGGRQPIANEDGSVVAAQNGEIYNFLDLSERLRSRGHVLQTRCDTEILSHMYEEVGEDLPRHLDGMFAICVFDKNRNRGLLARDRTGKKPLYYHVHGNELYFASEIKSLLRLPCLSREINWEAFHHFLSYKHVPAPLTIFEGIFMLPPAHRLVWQDGSIRSVEPYWQACWAAEFSDCSEDEIADGLLDVLERAVKRRLISDVPIGFFLSGGLDSSLSTCIAASVAGHQVKTFTLDYTEDSTTEGKKRDVECARLLSKQYGTEHHEEVLDLSTFPQEFPDILQHFDEPFSGVMSTWFLSRLIRKHVKVTLSGDGADELFGSYLSHRLAQPLANLKRGGGLEPFQERREYLEGLWEPNDEAWRYKLLVFKDDEKRALYTDDVQNATKNFSTYDHLAGYFKDLTATDPTNRILEAEFRGFFPDQVLAFVDRLSMAHSLEVRTAFLDTEVVEYAARIPGHLKIKNGETKYILKKAALKYLPPEVVYRPKEGFVMPVNQWLSTGLRPYVQDMLSVERVRRQGVFNPAAVSSLVQAFLDGRQESANKILSLLAFAVWYELYLGEGRTTLAGTCAA